MLQDCLKSWQKKIEKLQKALQDRNETLTKIEAIVDQYDYETFKTNNPEYIKQASALQKVAEKLVEIIKIDPSISRIFISQYGKENRFAMTYNAAEIALKKFEREVEQYAKTEGIYIQFGGWLRRKNETIPLHFQGFDDIKPQDNYEVDRWQLLPTKGQLQQIEDLQKLAKENKEKGLDLLRQVAEKQLEAVKNFGNIQLKLLIGEIKGDVTELEKTITKPIENELKEIFNSVDALQVGIDAFVKEIDSRMRYYDDSFPLKEEDLIPFLMQAKEDIDFITGEEGKNILNKTQELKDKIEALNTSLQKTAKVIVTSFKDLYEKYKGGYQSIKALASASYDQFLYGKKFDIAAQKFGEKVHKLSLANIPSSTEFDLYSAGVRSEGDRLGLKLQVTSKEKGTTVIEAREIYLFRILPHVETKVGAVFIDPIAKTDLQADFQFAPSYSLLFKGFFGNKRARKSIVYNRLLETSIGLHMTAPDFNKDDVPEIGTGLVLSTLNDYLQTGAGFNVFEGEFYWFFGLRIPFPTSNTPSNSINSNGN